MVFRERIDDRQAGGPYFDIAKVGDGGRQRVLQPEAEGIGLERADAPPFCCTRTVTALDAAAMRRAAVSRARAATPSFARIARGARGPNRSRGHQSSSRSTNGSVTSIGLAIRPSA